MRLSARTVLYCFDVIAANKSCFNMCCPAGNLPACLFACELICCAYSSNSILRFSDMRRMCGGRKATSMVMLWSQPWSRLQGPLLGPVQIVSSDFGSALLSIDSYSCKPQLAITANCTRKTHMCDSKRYLDFVTFEGLPNCKPSLPLHCWSVCHTTWRSE